MGSEQVGLEERKYLLDVWHKHEGIAMHFNDLILRIRTQALGAIAAVVTVGGVLLRLTPPQEPYQHWGVVAAGFGLLLVFWIAIWLLDFMYYNRLLMGAVDSLLGLEDAVNKGSRMPFDMSHMIEGAVLGEPPVHRRTGSLVGPLIFYVVVAAALVVCIGYSLGKFRAWF